MGEKILFLQKCGSNSGCVMCVCLVLKMRERDVSSGGDVSKRTPRGPRAAFLNDS